MKPVAVVTRFSRGPASRPRSGERWDVRLVNAKGQSLPFGDYPTPEAAESRARRLGAAVEWRTVAGAARGA